MSKTIVIVGFGPGVSTAVADKFGAEGFAIALIARNEERLSAGVARLRAKDIAVAGFPADASDPEAMREVIERVRAHFGSITIILWNAFAGHQARDLLAVDAATHSSIFDVAIVGLLATVREALPDLKAAEGGAILVTNGAAGDVDPQIDEYVTNHLRIMGVALANGAKHKLVGLLAQRLKSDGIYVGEVMIAGAIKGTATGDDNSIEGVTVADKFWDIYQARSEIRGRIVDTRRLLDIPQESTP